MDHNWCQRFRTPPWVNFWSSSQRITNKICENKVFWDSVWVDPCRRYCSKIWEKGQAFSPNNFVLFQFASTPVTTGWDGRGGLPTHWPRWICFWAFRNQTAVVPKESSHISLNNYAGMYPRRRELPETTNLWLLLSLRGKTGCFLYTLFSAWNVWRVLCTWRLTEGSAAIWVLDSTGSKQGVCWTHVRCECAEFVTAVLVTRKP